MRRRERRELQAQLMILGALVDGSRLIAYDLMKATRLSGGRLYVALAQLEHSGKINCQKIERVVAGEVRAMNAWAVP